MADDAIERVLRLVAEGRLTAEEAGPILDALADQPARGGGTGEPPGESPSGDSSARAIRIEVVEHGRSVVNLRVPLSLGRAAINRVPGLSEVASERIREAIAAGIRGPVLQVDDEDGGVRVTIE